MKIEVFLKELTVLKNGNLKGKPEDLILVAEWDDPSFNITTAAASIDLKQVKDQKVWTKNPDEPTDPVLIDLSHRLFKLEVEGASVIRFTLLKREQLGGIAKFLFSLFNSAALFAVGSVTAGVGAALAKTATGEILKAKEKWEDVLGEATFVVVSNLLPDGDLDPLEFELSSEARRSLRKLYTDKKKDPKTRRIEENLPPEVSEMADNPEAKNGSFILEVRRY